MAGFPEFTYPSQERKLTAKCTTDRRKEDCMRFKRIIAALLCVSFFMSVSACATTRERTPSPQAKAQVSNPHYNLVAERCAALGNKDMGKLQRLYAKDSDELRWIKEEVFPVLTVWPAIYRVVNMEDVRIFGAYAVGRFSINVSNRHKSSTELVDVVFAKEDSDWKIDYVVVAEGK